MRALMTFLAIILLSLWVPLMLLVGLALVFFVIYRVRWDPEESQSIGLAVVFLVIGLALVVLAPTTWPDMLDTGWVRMANIAGRLWTELRMEYLSAAGGI